VTIIKIMNLASAACGVLGALALYNGSFAYEHPGFLADAQNKMINEMWGRNRRRQRWQRFGLGLITISFLLQGVATTLDD
jgi:hypothetical protein